MADFSKLSAVTDKLATDFASLAADVKAYIAANPPANPADQAAVDAITSKLDTLDAGFADLDSSVKPGPVGGGTA